VDIEWVCLCVDGQLPYENIRLQNGVCYANTSRQSTPFKLELTLGYFPCQTLTPAEIREPSNQSLGVISGISYSISTVVTSKPETVLKHWLQCY